MPIFASGAGEQESAVDGERSSAADPERKRNVVDEIAPELGKLRAARLQPLLSQCLEPFLSAALQTAIGRDLDLRAHEALKGGTVGRPGRLSRETDPIGEKLTDRRQVGGRLAEKELHRGDRLRYRLVRPLQAWEQAFPQHLAHAREVAASEATHGSKLEGRQKTSPREGEVDPYRSATTALRRSSRAPFEVGGRLYPGLGQLGEGVAIRRHIRRRCGRQDGQHQCWTPER